MYQIAVCWVPGPFHCLIYVFNVSCFIFHAFIILFCHDYFIDSVKDFVRSAYTHLIEVAAIVTIKNGWHFYSHTRYVILIMSV